MSDSDDTDFLLSIPSDYFVISSSYISPNTDFAIENYHNSHFVKNIFPAYNYYAYHNHNELNSEKILSEPKSLAHNVNKAHELSENHQFSENVGNIVMSNDINFTTKCSKHNYLYHIDKFLLEMKRIRDLIKSNVQQNKDENNVKDECLSKKINEANENNILDLSISLDSKLTQCKKSVLDFIPSHLPNKLSKSLDDTNFSESPDKDFHFENFNYKETQNQKISKLTSDELQKVLESEISRRKQYEQIIHHLQSNLIEKQKSLTIALNSNDEKENVIKQLQLGWKQLIDHWKELENHRQELAEKLKHERTESKNNTDNWTKKIEEMNNRVNEISNVNSQYKIKISALERSIDDLLKSTKTKEEELKSKINETEELTEFLKIEKLNLLEELNQVNKNFSEEQEKYLALEIRNSDLEEQIRSLTKINIDLVREIEEEKNISSELKLKVSDEKQSTMETKNKLKDFYQNQLNTLLKEKIEKFRDKIEKIQNNAIEESHKQKQLAADRLESEITKLKKLHKLEISTERRKYCKYVNCLKSKLEEYQKKLQEMENQLKSNSIDKTELARRIRSLMESQWSQALNIISGNNEYFLKKSNFMHDNFKTSKMNITNLNCEDSNIMYDDFKIPTNTEECTGDTKYFDFYKNESTLTKKPPWK